MANIWDIPGQSTSPASSQTQWSGDLFYRNNGNYGQSQDWYNTPVGQTIREQNPNLAYGAYANQQGIANNDNTFNQWFYKQFPRFQQAYGMATMQNPNMSIDQFLATLPTYNQLQNEFNSMSPAATGRASGYAQYGPAVRWLNR